MKRLLAVVVMVLLLLSLFVACSSSGDSDVSNEASGGDRSSSSDSNDASSDEIVEINFNHRWPNEPRKSFYDQKIAEYMEANPNVKINVDAVLNDAYKEKIRVLISNENLPDIFTSWSDSFALNLVSSGRIMPLNDILAEDPEWSGNIMESQFAGFTFDDVTYGVPFTIDGKVFFYNKDIFAENNLEAPATYDEFIAVLDALQAAGYENPLVEGLQNTWAISHYMGTIFQRIIDPAVLEVDYQDGYGEFTDPGYLRGLEVFQELATYMGDLSTAITHEDARNMFGNGEIPIVYMQFAEIKLVEDIGGVDFGFFNFPAFADGKGDPNALTGAPEGWMLSKNAPPEAIDFLKFLTSAETAFEFTKVDGQLNAIIGAVTEENTSPARMEAYEIILNASASAPWFDNAVNINVADVFMRGGQSLATGQMTPEEIIKDAQEQAARLSKE
ncbi:raffinose/stachyose/melibiose transport system substrate-binding protein [Evansella vedderi]|uniref:Raffinose/stachyose/melibiose transport system substrate-binding protein n=1 Tax=Evansella vedderi TaxID=38282 RepID=A0ABT9ZP63_9BACI|nr:extracellular solute-binding protein [Evansella vedderi]MDQ0253026.1 raffinose/stachyose/melibiose transport system substrate-binding protein [Evansella vedderi]